MTPTDNELFELCKEVYERFPEWGFNYHLPFNFYKLTIQDDDDKLHDFIEIKTKDYIQRLDEFNSPICPLYASDYLLEKLQRPHTSVVFEYFKSFITVIRYNEEDVYIRRESDTPLKALLKLTIALHDAGELTSMENK